MDLVAIDDILQEIDGMDIDNVRTFLVTVNGEYVQGFSIDEYSGTMNFTIS